MKPFINKTYTYKQDLHYSINIVHPICMVGEAVRDTRKSGKTEGKLRGKVTYTDHLSVLK